MTIFYLIRHGETDYNRKGRYQGQTEIPMNDLGRRQSQTLATRMANVELDAIYTSDLSRAQECARLIAAGRPVLLDPRLREIDVGRVAGKTAGEIQSSEPGFWLALNQDPDHTAFPGGESTIDVQHRAVEAVTAIAARHPDGRLAVVTHGALITLVVCEVLGLPLSSRRHIVTGNCGLTIFEWGATARKLWALNDTGHLDESPCDVKTFI